jgi:hypothetical protein
VAAQFGQREHRREAHADEERQQRPRLGDLQHHGEVGPRVAPHRQRIGEADHGHRQHEIMPRAFDGFAPAPRQPVDADAHHQVQAAVVRHGAPDESEARQRILGGLVGPHERRAGDRAQCRVPEQQQQFDEQDECEQHVERVLHRRRKGLVRQVEIGGDLDADQVVLRRGNRVHLVGRAFRQGSPPGLLGEKCTIWLVRRPSGMTLMRARWRARASAVRNACDARGAPLTCSVICI